jgi:hypothetical protein
VQVAGEDGRHVIARRRHGAWPLERRVKTPASCLLRRSPRPPSPGEGAARNQSRCCKKTKPPTGAGGSTWLNVRFGAKYAVREVRNDLPDNRFVLRTDVKCYYASTDHLMLSEQLAFHIKDRRVLNLIGQYLRRTSERGGSFRDYEKGISLALPYPFIGIQNNSDVRFCIVDWSGIGSIGGNFAQT